MADKFIIEGAAFDGDGTTSAEATVAGGVGAWNTTAYFVQGTTPAFGTLAAGDVVYIRSKTSAGADITVTLTANVSVGSANATLVDWITWVIDDGTTWAGISGIFIITQSAAWQIAMRNYNRMVCRAAENLVMRTTNATHNGAFISLAGHSEINGALIDMGAVTANGAYIISSSNITAVLANCHFIINARFNGMIRQGNWGRITLVNPDIEVLSVKTEPIFQVGGSGGVIEIYGGQMRGAGATSGSVVGRITIGDIRTFGFQFPNTMTVVEGYPSLTQNSGTFHGLGSDGGVGANIATIWGQADTRNDGNYPTLAATLLNSSNTAFAWRIYQAAASRAAPSSITVQGMYQGTAAVKTITVELQVATTFSPTLDTLNTWVDLTYIDNATGLTKSVSTRAIVPAALATSTAAWSATTYGAVSLHKRKISVTTPTSVKQDTAIMVTLRSTATPGSVNDLIFLDPAVDVA